MTRVEKILSYAGALRSILRNGSVLLSYESALAFDETYNQLREEAIALDKEQITVRPEEYYITDDFGNYWDSVCPNCGQRTMQVVRPGKAQCGSCG